MAYIYLEELKKILPGILDQWIDKDDEGWKWIFQEIEQKCHVGKRLKGKKWQKKMMEDINKLYARSSVDNADIGMLAVEVKQLKTSIAALRDDIKAAKSMAETAKQRTEVDYSKYSGKSDGKISYCNPEDKDCKSCKYYCEPYEHCVTCKAYEHLGAKENE